jgi:hypothetical protein
MAGVNVPPVIVPVLVICRPFPGQQAGAAESDRVADDDVARVQDVAAAPDADAAQAGRDGP